VTAEEHHQFVSHNQAGICPEAGAALEGANRGHAPGYAEDAWTARARELLRDFFECDCQVWFVSNATAANSLAMGLVCRSYDSLICHELAHPETDECGAAEFFSMRAIISATHQLEGPGAPSPSSM
jgi:threonine aldolase